jgi:glycosyltransferase involved in cell wall biosynthesis
MKKDIPIVSIGMPVFNGEKFLRRALDSLLTQDYTNFELIISDNASTDATEKICREYAARDNRIKYVRQVKNLGSHENFNLVLQESRSEYFMWAADDDQWATGFIQSLLNALEKNKNASGAFPPYQLVEEETGNILNGIWTCDYESRSTFIRLIKFLRHYRDTCIYGLIRRKYLNDIKFTPWAWVNAKTPYNIAYPLVFSLLAKGDFLKVGEKPLWFKSVRISHGHSTPFTTNPLLGYLAHIIRKINLLTRSTRYIFLGSRSIALTLLIFPFLLSRVIVDCITPIYAALYIWLSGKKISQMSPHEIWLLGVR